MIVFSRPIHRRALCGQKHFHFADSLIMKPTITETKPDVSTITVQTASEPKRPEAVKEKRKKLRLIVIFVAVLVAIVAAAITIAFYVAGKQAEDNIKTARLPYKDESGTTSTQKVSVTSREEKFEITGTGTVIFDFDKSLLVYRPDTMSKQACYLTAVNTSYLLSPDKMKDLLGDKMTTDVPSKTSEHADFMSTDVVVPNTDFLAPLSKEMCKDTELIWMVPKPDCVNEKSLTREKRACYYYYYYYYFVWNGWLYYRIYWFLVC